VTEFATLLTSGLAVSDALVHLAAIHPLLAARLREAARQSGAGRPLSDALLTSGLIPASWQPRLQWAERCGDVPAVLADLSREQAHARERLRRLRARMMPGWALLVILLLVAMVMASVRGCGWSGLVGMCLPVLAVTGLAVLLGRSVTVDGLQAARYMRRWGLDRVSEVCALHVSRLWADWIMRGLRAGLPAVEVMASLAPLYPDDAWRRSVRAVGRRLARGESLGDTLLASGWSLPPALRAALVTGEATGRIDESLRHWLTLSQQTVELSLASVSGSLPWVFYVAVLVAAGLLA
jgi:type II secretory pathway component PulF